MLQQTSFLPDLQAVHWDRTGRVDCMVGGSSIATVQAHTDDELRCELLNRSIHLDQVTWWVTEALRVGAVVPDDDPAPW